MELLVVFSPSTGPRQVGALDRWAKYCSPHMQGHAVQWDHRAHWEHSALHGTDGAPRHPPEARYIHRSHWYRQECLHYSESSAFYYFINVTFGKHFGIKCWAERNFRLEWCGYTTSGRFKRPQLLKGHIDIIFNKINFFNKTFTELEERCRIDVSVFLKKIIMIVN